MRERRRLDVRLQQQNKICESADSRCDTQKLANKHHAPVAYRCVAVRLDDRCEQEARQVEKKVARQDEDREREVRQQG